MKGSSELSRRGRYDENERESSQGRVGSNGRHTIPSRALHICENDFFDSPDLAQLYDGQVGPAAASTAAPGSYWAFEKSTWCLPLRGVTGAAKKGRPESAPLGAERWLRVD